MIFTGVTDVKVIPVKNTGGFSDVLEGFQPQSLRNRHNGLTFHFLFILLLIVKILL